MSRIVFHHADKDLTFTVSTVHWDEQDLHTEEEFSFPIPGDGDAGKFLVIGTDGKAHYTAVKPGAVDFHLRTINLTGNHGSPILNLNNMTDPLQVNPSELVIIHDNESGKSFIWAGGVGTFGTKSGGGVISEHMLTEIKAGDTNMRFASGAEVAQGIIDDKALNPENAEYLDVDGGKY